MATNTGKGFRKGSVKDRSQTKTKYGNYIKRGPDGRFMDVKTTDKTPFKGIAIEIDGRKQ